MDSKGLCVLIKILTLISSLVLFNACASNAEPQPYILNKSRTSSCQSEMEQTISELIYAQNLQISEDVFSKTSSLNLTNKKDGILNQSPIFNDMGGRKTLLLYQQENALYIGLINTKKDIVKSKKLQKCH